MFFEKMECVEYFFVNHNKKKQSFEDYSTNRTLVGRFDDRDLTQRPAFIPRTGVNGIVVKAIVAETDLQQHYNYEEEVRS